ncbi:MAG: helix-turn-helix domain-containing protein [Desulfovibrionaceae bacterium]|nr:helix-turn-helix domain-containing protein [Desulfovibrionaceae bacterium]
MSRLLTAVVGYPDFDPFVFSIPGAVFAGAAAEQHFRLITVTGDGGPISSGALTLHPDGDLSLADAADLVIVPGWHDLDERPSPALVSALIRAHERGAWVAGLCYGAYPLAYAGLLDGRAASTHWMAEEDFRRRFPKALLNANSLYAEQDRVVTSAGVGAGVDCCLFLVRQFCGIRTANRLARAIVMPPYREGGQAQYIERSADSARTDDRLRPVLDHMLAHLDGELGLDALAKLAGMSRRSFTRHFARAAGMPCGAWLTVQRLRAGCELLESTDLSIEEIAEKIGFHSSGLFRQHFARMYQVSPTAWRRSFQGDRAAEAGTRQAAVRKTPRPDRP